MNREDTIDPLTWLLRGLANLIGGMSDAAASLIFRATLLFGLTTLLAGLAFNAGSRSIFTQSLACGIGIFVAAFFPLGWLIEAAIPIRAFFLTVGLILLAFIPSRLPFYLTPNRPLQKRIQIGSYGLLLAMLVLLM